MLVPAAVDMVNAKKFSMGFSATSTLPAIVFKNEPFVFGTLSSHPCPLITRLSRSGFLAFVANIGFATSV
jgi:hypothetical protein